MQQKSKKNKTLSAAIDFGMGYGMLKVGLLAYGVAASFLGMVNEPEPNTQYFRKDLFEHKRKPDAFDSDVRIYQARYMSNFYRAVNDKGDIVKTFTQYDLDDNMQPFNPDAVKSFKGEKVTMVTEPALSSDKALAKAFGRNLIDYTFFPEGQIGRFVYNQINPTP